MNVYDSGQILKMMRCDNYKSTSSFANADLIIVNTCAIREKAVQKVYSFLGRLSGLKKENADLIIVVAGCVAQQQGSKLVKRFPHVDIVLGTHAVYQLPDLLLEVKNKRHSIVEIKMSHHIDELESARGMLPQTHEVSSEVSGFVTIMRGCDNYCTYCVVPYVRGREVSRKPDLIVSEIKDLVHGGVKEVTLLGQNVNSYGVKEGLTSFPDLLALVNEIKGLDRIRFVTSHPKDLSDQLIEAFVKLDKLCNHIHLPVQSGSNRILKKMNRKYTRESYLEEIKKLRDVMPEIAMTTDIIVGFPGETDEDFEQTIELIKTVQFDGLYSFEYSDRPEAPATHFSDKVESEIKKSRLQTLLKLQAEITTKKHRFLVGRIFPVLVEGISKNQRKKISASSSLEICGRTPENRIVNFDCPPHWGLDIGSLKGQIINIKIEKVFSNSLRGTPVDNQGKRLKLKGAHLNVA